MAGDNEIQVDDSILIAGLNRQSAKSGLKRAVYHTQIMVDETPDSLKSGVGARLKAKLDKMKKLYEGTNSDGLQFVKRRLQEMKGRLGAEAPEDLVEQAFDELGDYYRKRLYDIEVEFPSSISATNYSLGFAGADADVQFTKLANSTVKNASGSAKVTFGAGDAKQTALPAGGNTGSGGE